jgi:acetolactate synthase-1/2/3 large subunit
LPETAAIVEAAKLIAAARHPVIIAGELIGLERAHEALAKFAEAAGAGVVSAFRRQDVITTNHAANLGMLGLSLVPYQKRFWPEVDLVVIAGARPDGCTMQDHTLLRPDQAVVHLYPEPKAFAETTPRVALEADAKPALEALCAALKGHVIPAERLAWRAREHASYLRFATAGLDVQARAVGAIDMAAVTMELARQLPIDASVVNDSGAFASWFHRHYPYRAPFSQLAACLGAMGYGMPGAIGAQLARPDKTVVAVMGDGGFLMTGQEIVTAVQEKLPITVIVCDNGIYGSIATHQYRRGGRAALYGTVMNSPDFAALARAYGAAAWTVNSNAEFGPALSAALAHQGGPALLHLKTDPRDLNAYGPPMAA